MTGKCSGRRIVLSQCILSRNREIILTISTLLPPFSQSLLSTKSSQLEWGDALLIYIKLYMDRLILTSTIDILLMHTSFLKDRLNSHLILFSVLDNLRAIGCTFDASTPTGVLFFLLRALPESTAAFPAILPVEFLASARRSCFSPLLAAGEASASSDF